MSVAKFNVLIFVGINENKSLPTSLFKGRRNNRSFLSIGPGFEIAFCDINVWVKIRINRKPVFAKASVFVMTSTRQVAAASPCRRSSRRPQ
jgi:hypothetical protein